MVCMFEGKCCRQIERESWIGQRGGVGYSRGGDVSRDAAGRGASWRSGSRLPQAEGNNESGARGPNGQVSGWANEQVVSCSSNLGRDEGVGARAERLGSPSTWGFLNMEGLWLVQGQGVGESVLGVTRWSSVTCHLTVFKGSFCLLWGDQARGRLLGGETS